MKQLIKFGIVGVFNTLITFAVYNILARGFGISIHVANAIGYIAGVVNSYIFNKNWVFGAKGQKDINLILKFAVVNVISYVFNAGILVVASNFILNKTLVQIPGTIVGMGVNFVLNKVWTFEKK